MREKENWEENWGHFRFLEKTELSPIFRNFLILYIQPFL